MNIWATLVFTWAIAVMMVFGTSEPFKRGWVLGCAVGMTAMAIIVTPLGGAA